MKYSTTEGVLWSVFAGACFRYLSGQGIQVDRRRARKIYREMAARTPDTGSLRENPLRMCLSGGMVWLSIYEAAEGKLPDKTFGQMVESSMCTPLIRAVFKSKAKTAFTLETQKNRARVAEKTNALAKSNPFHWSCEVLLGRDADEYTINYHQCGLCALGKQEGLSRLIPYLCVLDTLTVDWMGGVLRRTKRLATGGDCCDFYMCRKGSKWDES